MQFSMRRESFDGDYISSVALNRQNKTGQYEITIQNNCTRAALA
jgi:hypothetical protein